MEKWNAFLNEGTKTAVFIKKAGIILSLLLAVYGLGYGFGTFLANLGF